MRKTSKDVGFWSGNEKEAGAKRVFTCGVRATRQNEEHRESEAEDVERRRILEWQ